MSSLVGSTSAAFPIILGLYDVKYLNVVLCMVSALGMTRPLSVRMRLCHGRPLIALRMCMSVILPDSADKCPCRWRSEFLGRNWLL